MRVLLCGAGIAGATLAWWLVRDGHVVTVVEKAPEFRSGGYVVDFWGAGYDIVTRMGLGEAVERQGYRVQDLRAVDDEGRQVAGFPVEVFRKPLHGRFITVPRSALAAVIWEAVETRVESLFGNTVVSLEQTTDAVQVTFEHGGAGVFDLVVGTDGLHSRMRELAFGPQARFERYLGVKVAAFEVEGYRPRDELTYVLHTHVGRQIGRFSLRDDRTLFLFTFADVSPELPQDLEAQKAFVRAHFQGDGWETPAILRALDSTDRLYLDRVSQIRMPTWTEGRVTLVGDAAACPSLLAGEGSGLAITAACVLAGELRQAGGDVQRATTAYQARCYPFVLSKQEAALGFASFFAPRSKWALWMQHLMMNLMRVPWIGGPLVARSFSDDIALDEYWTRS